MGDSLIWGVGAQDSGTLPALAAETLSPASACLNLGVGSYSLWDYAVVLREETFETYHPTILVLGISTNDWIDDVMRVRLVWTSYLEDKLRMLGRIPSCEQKAEAPFKELTAIFESETAAESCLEMNPGPSMFDLFLLRATFDDDRWKKALDPLNEIIQSCKENDCRLIVICFAQDEEFLPGFEELRPQQVLIDHLRAEGISVIIGHDLLAADPNPFRFYPFENDGMHINQEGYNVYAQALQPYLNR